MILYVNACVRTESRTNRLAKALLDKLGAFEEVRLTDLEIKPLNEESLNYREAQIEKQNYDDSMKCMYTFCMAILRQGKVYIQIILSPK